MQNKEEVLEILGKCGERTIIIFLYRFIFKLSLEEIARERGLSISACNYHLRKMRRLHRVMDKHQECISALQELLIHGQVDRFLNKIK